MLVMNLFAMNSLQQHVIRVMLALEHIESSGAGGGQVVAAPALSSEARTPGSGTGFIQVGWGGVSAEVLHVEGAVPNAPVTASQKPKPQGDTYVNRRSQPPSTLNYYTTNEGDAGTISKYTLGRLMIIDPEAPPKVLPSLATRWEVSEDKLTYTYHLRRGVLFADGRPFSAKDVKFSFDVMRDPEVRSEHMRASFDDVISLETPDEYTVVVKYRKKYWGGVYAVGFKLRILNSAWVADQIPKYAKELDIANHSTKPGTPGFGEVFNKIRHMSPGTGPYYYPGDKYDPDIPVELVQNPFWFGMQLRPEQYNLKKLKWVFIQDPVAAFEEFRRQTFDVTVVEFQPWDDEYSKDPTITDIANYFEYDHIGLGYSFIAWNGREPPFDDPRVRKAMAHLLDRDWVVEQINRGRATVASAPCKRAYPCYDNDVPHIPYDIDKAKALLAEAGWVDTDGDGILDRDGKRFEFELKLGSTRRFYVQIAAALDDACKKVGIRMSTRTLEWSTFIQDYYERRFDAVSLVSSFPDPWIDPYEEFHSSQDVPQGGNSAGWHNDEVDDILTRMREEFDDDKRAALFHEFNLIFQEEMPVLLVTHPLVGVVQNKRFEGVEVYPTGLRMHNYWVKPENVKYK
jgi:peptide/nickel transport system substrate-binding protein